MLEGCLLLHNPTESIDLAGYPAAKHPGSMCCGAAQGRCPIIMKLLQVVTISGRTIRKEAQVQPELSDIAIRKINELLAKVPEESVRRAEDMRAQRRAVAV